MWLNEQYDREYVTQNILPERHLLLLEAIIGMFDNKDELNAQSLMRRLHGSKNWDIQRLETGLESRDLDEDIEDMYLRGFLYVAKDEKIYPTTRSRIIYDDLHGTKP